MRAKLGAQSRAWPAGRVLLVPELAFSKGSLKCLDHGLPETGAAWGKAALGHFEVCHEACVLLDFGKRDLDLTGAFKSGKHETAVVVVSQPEMERRARPGGVLLTDLGREEASLFYILIGIRKTFETSESQTLVRRAGWV